MLFGLFGKSWDASDMPDLTGRVAIVTGGNTGIGIATVRELARRGTRVYILSRNESRVLEAIESVKKETPEAMIKYINFDLLRMQTAKTAAEEFLQHETRLDMLINNAGIMATPYEIGPDGIEIQACNGTGHFALTMALLPTLKDTASKPGSHVRIVNVTSKGYQLAQNPNFKTLDDLNQKCRSTWNRYGNGKLSNILFTNELQKRLEGTGVYCLSVHPGTVNTELTRGMVQSWPIIKPLLGLGWLVLLTPYQGALNSLYAATSPEVEEKDLRAAYLEPIAQVTAKKAYADDKGLAEDFWNLCEQLVAEKLRL
ncbi:short chain dehydrogenase [Mucidula mucida]|nr:short chain dehydrogenase [Mucidula mucida]